jgi:hypothetical protein
MPFLDFQHRTDPRNEFEAQAEGATNMIAVAFASFALLVIGWLVAPSHHTAE